MDEAGRGTSRYTIEAEFLLASSRTVVDPVVQARIRTLAERGLDWRRLLHLSTLHGTAPLLYRTLSTTCPNLIPPEFFRSLQQYYGAVVLQNARMASAVVGIIAILKARGIDVRPLKGPALAVMAYGDVTLREFGDLDLLTKERDIAAAIDTLITQDFVYLTAGQEGDPTGSGSKYHVLRRKRDGIVVDLQWMLAHEDFSFSLEHKCFWERPYVIKLAGAEVPTLSPGATLLLLCVHGSKHLWSHLKWTCDVAELLRRHPDLDWDWLLGVARELGCRRMLVLGLLLARNVLDAPVTDSVLKLAGSDAVVEGLAVRLANRLRAGEDPVEPDTFHAPEYLLLRDRFRDRMQFMLHLCIWISPKDRASLRAFPASFQALYYALLPLRVIGRRIPVPRLKAAVSNWLERMG